MPAIRYWPAVEFKDHITIVKSSFLGRALRRHIANNCAAVFLQLEFVSQGRRNVLDPHTGIAAGHLPVTHQTGYDIPGKIRWDREADAVIAAGAAQDGGIDA